MKQVALIVALTAALAHAQDHFQPTPVATNVPDLQVTTQSGAHLRFNSELIKGRTAIVTGFFTSCTAMCPITQEKLAQVARLLGPRLGKDVIIVSLSTDPEHDTPARMKAWGRKFHVGPGWVLAAGNKTEVETLLKSLGLYVEIPQRHQSALMVGSSASGWFRISSWTPADKLAALVDTLGAAKKPPAGTANSAMR